MIHFMSMRAGRGGARRFLAMAPLLAVWWAMGAAAEPAPGTGAAGDAALPFEMVRLPRFRAGRLANEIKAERADAALSDPELPVVNMTGVSISIYDPKSGPLRPNRPPALSMQVTSRRGAYRRQRPAPGRPVEEIAYLEGDVLVIRYAAGREITRIKCDYARWNHTRQYLVGEGKVAFIQADSVIEGEDFDYNPEREAPADFDDDPESFRGWGGQARIKNNVVMTVGGRTAKAGPGAAAAAVTTVRCRGVASYNIDERRIQFEEDVRVERPGLFLSTGPGPNGVLQVLLGEDDRVASFTALGEVNLRSVPRSGESARGEAFEATGDRADLSFLQGYLRLSRYGDADMRIGRRPSPRPPAAVLTRPGGQVDRISDAEIVFLLDDPPAAGAGLDLDADPADLAAALASGGGAAPGAGVLRELRASGGVGRASFTAEGRAAVIRYRGALSYQAASARVRVEQVDRLELGDGEGESISLAANLVQFVRLAAGQAPAMEAEGDVRLRRGDWTAGADLMQVDPAADRLVLFSRQEEGRYLPPFPWFENETRGARFEAPLLDLLRQDAGDGRKAARLSGRGGRCLALIRTAAGASGERRGVSIVTDGAMEFNEASRLAYFVAGQTPVAVESADPEDQFVLDCGILSIMAEPVEAPAAAANPNADGLRTGEVVLPPEFGGGELVRMRIQSIIAAGHRGGRWPATLRRGAWECTGAHIQQKTVPDGIRVDVMRRSSIPDVPEHEARIAGDGLRFRADYFAVHNQGDIILAGGKGEFEIPDHGGLATVAFSRQAEYQSPESAARLDPGAAARPGGPRAKLRFFDDVALSRQAWNMRLSCHFLEVVLRPVPGGGGVGGIADASPDELRRQIESAEARGRVDSETRSRYVDPHGGVVFSYRTGGENVTREARGDTAHVDFAEAGAEIFLQAEIAQDPARRVLVRDSDGVRMTAPSLQANLAGNVFRAAGPGEAFIPGAFAGGRQTTVRYRASLDYSEARGEIAAQGEVYFNLGDLYYGSGERLRIKTVLDIDELAARRRPNASWLELSGARNYDVNTGFAEFRRYPPPDSARPTLPPEGRVGDTMRARAARIAMDVTRNRVHLDGLVRHHKPQVVLQRIHPDAAGAPGRKERFRAIFPKNADLGLQRTQLKDAQMSVIAADGPLVFDENQ